MAKKLQLTNFIDAYGLVKLANDLGITRQAVMHWHVGTHAPTPIIAYKIIQLSNGLVDFNSIYLPFVELASDVNKNLNQEG
jgi:DNA-binding XRE family transcriptional regulator